MLDKPPETAELRERRYVTAEELCKRLPGTTTAYWADHRFHGTGPEFVKLSHKKVVYPEDKLEESLEARQRTSTREGGDAA